jgi:predicted patatin/cPLA2 family phospholipase
MSNLGVVTGVQCEIDPRLYAEYLTGRTALVTQGGGQCGIFTSGVLDAFLLSNFDPFDVFYGTSAGALNISAFLCRQSGIGKSFTVDLTTDDRFFHLFSYIRRKKKMDLDWAINQLCHFPYKLDLDLGRKILTGRRAFAAVTEVDYIRDRYIPLLAPNWVDIMRATCAIPGLYSEEVVIDGERYVDGGVTAAIPVQEAWRQGSRNIIAIRTEFLDDTDTLNEEPAIQSHWIKEPISKVQEHWGNTVEQWKKEWADFRQEQIEKSKQKNKHHAHLDILNGGRWLYGAGDVYRLSHLLGGKFDSGLADFFMVHYQTQALTREFLASPPDDCFIVQIAPSEPLKSSPLMSKKEDLLYDYDLGLSAGYQFIKQYNKARQHSPNFVHSKCNY